MLFTPDVDWDPASYGSWDLSPVPLPPRSRLYHLAPIGVGTAEVESLTGYLVRLAAAHSVSPFVLVRGEIAAAFASERRAQIHIQLSALMGCAARRLDGLEPDAGRWTDALAALTGRRDLAGLTLRRWAGVIASHDLLRATRAWCPACYAAWRVEGRDVYQPLLWTLLVVTVCARHRQPLRDRCPRSTCRRPQPLIAPAIQPGYCTACGSWLGEGDDVPAEGSPPIPEAALAWKLWVAEVVGEMLATSALLGGPFPHGRVREVLEECIARLSGDRPLRRLAHLSWYTIRLWRRGTVIPTLGLLLRFCHHLDTTPCRLLTMGAATVTPGTAGRPMTPDAPKARRPRGWFDAEAGRRAIAAALAGAPEALPSVAGIARDLECPVWTLRSNLPAECCALVERRAAQHERAEKEARARRCAEVRCATVTVHQQGLYPNGRRVAELLNRPTDMIRVEVRSAWQDALRDLGWQPRRRGGYRA